MVEKKKIKQQRPEKCQRAKRGGQPAVRFYPGGQWRWGGRGRREPGGREAGGGWGDLPPSVPAADGHLGNAGHHHRHPSTSTVEVIPSPAGFISMLLCSGHGGNYEAGLFVGGGGTSSSVASEKYFRPGRARVGMGVEWSDRLDVKAGLAFGREGLSRARCRTIMSPHHCHPCLPWGSSPAKETDSERG